MGILKYLKNKLLLTFVLLSLISYSFSQQKIIDQIIAVIGNDIVLQSELETQILQLEAQGYDAHNDIECEVLEQLLIEKLLIHQARIDSIIVSQLQVEDELNRRLEYIILQVGSKQKVLEQYNKTIDEIKEDLRDQIADQLLAQTMQQNILGDIKITPSEVSKLYNSLPKDSLPFIESKIELRQIIIHPSLSDEAIFTVRQKLLKMRKRVIDGENFSTLAILYSEDPGSAARGGELGMTTKDELVPEFSKAALRLKKGAVSNIVETEYGYHIIQLIDKEETRFNVRHILLKPKVSILEKRQALNKLDSISRMIRLDSITFEQAARKFSEDPLSKMNEGTMINKLTLDTKFELQELSKSDYFAIKNLKIGQISDPFETIDENGKTIFKIIQKKSQITPHYANLNEDYPLIQEFVKNQKQQKIIKEWLEEKQADAFIKINKNYMNCAFESKGWIK